jgi:tetratricopeptide (TPR) repeat protein
MRCLRADWPKVADAARAWQQHEPDAVVAAWLLGYAGLATGDYRLATEGFQRLDAPQTSAQLHTWAGALVIQHPQNAIAQMLRGDALARSGHYTEALTALDEAGRLPLPTALLYDVRGVVRTLAGQAEAAEADFRRAWTLDGQFADTYCSLGLLQLRQGMVAAAIASFTRALELAPEHPAARNARGVAYLHAGIWPKPSRISPKSSIALPAFLWR